MLRLLAFPFVYAAVWVLAGCSPMLYVHGVPNLDKVEDRMPGVTSVVLPDPPGVGAVYRGGQPTPEGWAYLKSIGVRTVVKLDYETEGSDDEARRLGMVVLPFSMPPGSATDLLRGPPVALLKTIIEAIVNADGSVYVHCLHGQDRTGLVIGAYRLLLDQWSKGDAWREMRAHHFHPALLGLLDAWEDLAP